MPSHLLYLLLYSGIWLQNHTRFFLLIITLFFFFILSAFFSLKAYALLKVKKCLSLRNWLCSSPLKLFPVTCDNVIPGKLFEVESNLVFGQINQSFIICGMSLVSFYPKSKKIHFQIALRQVQQVSDMNWHYKAKNGRVTSRNHDWSKQKSIA